MPVADYSTYCRMIDRALSGHFAYPAFNVTSMATASAVLRGLAESKSDGIIQVSTGGGAFAAGSMVKDMALGAMAIADYVHRVADRYPVYVALHTDHCQADKLSQFVIPLIEETERRRASGLPNLFNSHMFDGSALPLKDNLDIAVKLLERCHSSEIILEIEAGVVGGEEDGVKAQASAKLFGNVHGVYKPGQVKLKPSILKDCQDAVVKAYGETARFALVFHGGSGSTPAEISEAVDYGVVKMNIDTDTQYAFTRPIADHMLKNYDGVLKVDGEVGSKKAYDPRTYLSAAEKAMAERVKQAVKDLRGEGTSLFKAGCP